MWLQWFLIGIISGKMLGLSRTGIPSVCWYSLITFALRHGAPSSSAKKDWRWSFNTGKKLSECMVLFLGRKNIPHTLLSTKNTTPHYWIWVLDTLHGIVKIIKAGPCYHWIRHSNSVQGSYFLEDWMHACFTCSVKRSFIMSWNDKQAGRVLLKPVKYGSMCHLPEG